MRMRAAPPRWRTYLVIALAWSASVWALGLAFMAYEAYSDAADARARYEHVELPAGQHSPGASHVALAGMALADKVVVRQSKAKNAMVSGTDFYMVPIAQQGWRQGQPVQYVAQVVHDEELEALVHLSGRNENMVLGRVVGGVPETAVTVLAGMGVPVKAGAVLVRWIPSSQGQPAVQDRLGLYWQRTWTVCGALGLLVSAFVLLRGFAVIHMRPGGGPGDGAASRRSAE